VQCVENVARQHSPHSAHILPPDSPASQQLQQTDNYSQGNAVGSPDDGHKDVRNMLRYYWLPINHYLLHLVGLTFTYLLKMHGHSNIKYGNQVCRAPCMYTARLTAVEEKLPLQHGASGVTELPDREPVLYSLSQNRSL